MTELCNEVYHRVILRRHTIADILWRIYHGRCITADILPQIHYSRCIACHKNNNISTNLQRQKLSISESEPVCCNVSHQDFCGLFHLEKGRRNQKRNTLGPHPWRGSIQVRDQNLSLTYIGVVYGYIYIHIYIYIYI